MKTLENIVLAGKTALIRVDFNIPLSHGKIKDSQKIESALPTIKYAIANGAKVLLLSHLGRPKTEADQQSHSLRVLVPELENKLCTKVHFSDLQNAASAVQKLRPGEVMLLENIRFHPGEYRKDPQLADDLASQLVKLADLYVNEAFACSHRDHTSITALAELMPSFAGFHLKQEVEVLTKILNQPSTPLLLIMGGGKVESKLQIMRDFIKNNQPFKVALGGILANSVLKHLNYPIGASTAGSITDFLGIEPSLLELPQDAKTSTVENPNQSHLCTIEDIPECESILDLGPATVMKYIKLIEQAGTVIWNGPLGYCELDQFKEASDKIAHHISHLTLNRKLVSLVGGGETTAYLTGKHHVFSHVSVGGGAFLEWISKRELVGLRALAQHCSSA